MFLSKMKSPRKKIAVAIGTRPEAIKMAPVIIELRSRKSFSVNVLATGQHTDMLNQALDYFYLKVDVNLRIMRSRQSLDYITSSVLQGVGDVLDEWMPDAVLVHGDTTTTLASAMAAFYRGIPVGHVEAGLRSFNMRRPFPEEMNRVVTDKISTWWFAPTELAARNLRQEGVPDNGIHVTGNTVVDALYAAIQSNEGPTIPILRSLDDGAPFILLTAHRRESWGKPLKNICHAVRRLIEKWPGYRLLVPMHKNPTVRDTITDILGDLEGVILCDPLDYPNFVWALNKCILVLSDSGGVQEEATSTGKPLLILRDLTERPEAVEQGSCILVGTDEERIFTTADLLLSDPTEYRKIQKKGENNPFGDGKAAMRVADVLERSLCPLDPKVLL